DRSDIQLQRPPFQSNSYFLDQIVSALMIDQRAAVLKRHVLQQLRVTLARDRQRLEREPSSKHHRSALPHLAFRADEKPVRGKESILRFSRARLRDIRAEQRPVELAPALLTVGGQGKE